MIFEIHIYQNTRKIGKKKRSFFCGLVNDNWHSHSSYDEKRIYGLQYSRGSPKMWSQHLDWVTMKAYRLKSGVQLNKRKITSFIICVPFAQTLRKSFEQEKDSWNPFRSEITFLVSNKFHYKK